MFCLYLKPASTNVSTGKTESGVLKPQTSAAMTDKQGPEPGLPAGLCEAFMSCILFSRELNMNVTF